jgi:NAD(P)-dependent dehydrogenase (short-subunit alcohol dehydrogenase family)
MKFPYSSFTIFELNLGLGVLFGYLHRNRKRQTQPMDKPQQKVALVTGASSGLGDAIAKELIREGWVVFGTSRSERSHGSVKWLSVDLRCPSSIRAMAESLLTQTDRLDAIIHNAGVALSGPAESTSLADIQWQMDINFYGAVLMNQWLTPVMRKYNSGRILFISSIGGKLGLPFQAFYSASKFALEGYAEALSIELKPFGIWVSLIQPGDFNTGITDRRMKPVKVPSAYETAFNDALKRIELQEREGSDPKLLARQVVKIIGYKKPRLHYQSGKWDQRLSVLLKRLLPGRTMERIMADYYNCWE